MKRSSSTLLSIGVSAALIAAGIWFLGSRYGVGYGGRDLWLMPHGMMAAGGMGVVMILFWGIVVIAIALIFSGAFAGRNRTHDDSRDRPEALQILERRYASGEIDKAQFEDMRKGLNV